MGKAGTLEGNIYQFGLRRILVTKDLTFSHVSTKEWGGKDKIVEGNRVKKELNLFELICNINSLDDNIVVSL